MATPAPLFLDAARLGAMSPTAQLAARDFARLAGEGLSTLYWEEFFRGRLHRATRLSGLKRWRGISGLQSDIRHLLGAFSASHVVFASRTSALMQSVVDLLASQCHRIFTTDTLWPSYNTLLSNACRSQGATLRVLPIRTELVRARWSGRELVEHISQDFIQTRSEAAFLTSVSHDGIRLPLTAVVAALRAQNPQAFIIVDGAQEFAHIPVRLTAAPCDAYIAGCHKWLGAYQSLGIAVLGNPLTANRLEGELRQLLADPLFRYLRTLSDPNSSGPCETVNLTPLLCAHGALKDHHGCEHRGRFLQQLRNAMRAADLAKSCGWNADVRPPGLRSGILLLRSREAHHRSLTADEMQREFGKAGVVVTAYGSGVIRLSLPGRRLQPAEWRTLQRALRPSPPPAASIRLHQVRLRRP